MSSIGSILSSVVLASSIITSVVGAPVAPSIQQRSSSLEPYKTLHEYMLSFKDYSVMSQEGVAAIQPVQVTGIVSVESEAITYLTGFDPTVTQLLGLDASTDPKPFADMLTTYTNIQNMAVTQPLDSTPAALELGDGTSAEGVFVPGVYEWTTAVVLGVGSTMVLDGDEKAVWIFRSAGEFSTGADSRVQLKGGAKAENVFWIGATSLVTGANSLFQGNIMTYTNVVIGTGSELVGKIFSQTEVALQMATVNNKISGPWQCGTSAC